MAGRGSALRPLMAGSTKDKLVQLRLAPPAAKMTEPSFHPEDGSAGDAGTP